MPWNEQRKMSLKIEFVEKAARPGANMSRLCAEYEISRETGYKWLNRYRKEGSEGLEERSRRPKSSPLATAEDLVLAVLELREKHPRRGPKKLVRILERKFAAQTPSISTIARILRRAGKVRQRSRFRRLSVVDRAPRTKASSCNEVWTVDFKGWWRVRDGQRCDPLTVRDAFSRFILAVKVFKKPSMEGVRAVFEQLFQKYGLPKAIHSDNGWPFINVQARGGLTALSSWWVSLGIRLIRSRPGCPQDNGGHERMHRDISEDLQSFPAGSIEAEQRACDRWKQEFNHVRPHEALGGKTPAEVYRRSERTPRVTSHFYPPTWIVRTVTDQGKVNIDYAQFIAGRSLARERVGFQPLGGTRYRLWFRHMDLGTIELPVRDLTIDTVAEEFIERRKRKVG